MFESQTVMSSASNNADYFPDRRQRRLGFAITRRSGRPPIVVNAEKGKQTIRGALSRGTDQARFSEESGGLARFGEKPGWNLSSGVRAQVKAARKAAIQAGDR